MTELIYNFKDIYGKTTTVKLVQPEAQDIWLIQDGEFILARISRIHGAWKQLSGEMISKEFLRGAGSHIEKNYYDSVPLLVKQRWPKLIMSSERSGSELIVVCTPKVSLTSFRPIFCKYVSALFKEEINIDLRVYSHDFTQDFKFRLDVKGKREKLRAVGAH
jgi:hypothetical protein